MRTRNTWSMAGLLALVALAASCVTTRIVEPPPAVQPGAPGEPTQAAAEREVPESSAPDYSPADVAFMHGMIAHHAQALEMAALVPSRTDDEQIELLAERVVLSQNTEIEAMQNWLAERGESVPEVGEMMDHGAHSMADIKMGMPGMLTPEQMAELAAANGDEFDQLFLRSMIQHHLGALTMVEELFESPQGGQGSEIFQIAEGIAGDQRIEIMRMRQMLAS